MEKLPEGVQPQISVEELLLCEEIIRKDERVIKLAAEVGELDAHLHAMFKEKRLNVLQV